MGCISILFAPHLNTSGAAGVTFAPHTSTSSLPPERSGEGKATNEHAARRSRHLQRTENGRQEARALLTAQPWAGKAPSPISDVSAGHVRKFPEICYGARFKIPKHCWHSMLLMFC